MLVIMKHLNASQRMREIQVFGEQGGVVPSIDVAATSTFMDPEDMERMFRGELEGCYLYSRHSNPSVHAFSTKMAAMEGAEAGLGVASGMAAIHVVCDQLLRSGGHMVASRVVYGGTFALFRNVLESRGVNITWVDPANIHEWARAIRPETKLLYTESISNPLLRVSPLGEIAALAKKSNIPFVVDNTFAPLLIEPIRWGADIVIHSATKFISGSSDCIAGVVLGSHSFIASLMDVNSGAAMLYGPVLDAKVAHELNLRLDHLPARMSLHSQYAQFFADRVQKAGFVTTYLGLPGHPDYERFRALSSFPELGAGGMVVVDLGSRAKASAVAQELQRERFGYYAVSLGFTRTLMSIPASSTSSEIPEEERNALGLKEGLLRLSIGCLGDIKVQTDLFIQVAGDMLRK